MPKQIYLDNSTTTKPSETVILAMMPYLENYVVSSTSPQANNFAALEKSYQAIYKLVGASEKETFVLTSCSEEAISQVVTSVYREVTLQSGKNHFVTSSIENAAIRLALTHLEEEGCKVTTMQVTKEGIVTKEKFIEAISPRTALVSLSLVSGLTGVIQPIDEIGAICKERGILLHVDASYAVGKLALDFTNSPINYLSFGGDLFHAPKGSGGLFIKNAQTRALIAGANEARTYRGGSVNTIALAGLGQASLEAKDATIFMCTEVARLRSLFEQKIQEGYPEAILLFQDSERAPNSTTISFPGIYNELLLFALDRKEVIATMGGGLFLPLTALLEQCGVEKRVAECALSFSLSRLTTHDEVERAAQIVCAAAKRLRKLSKELV